VIRLCSLYMTLAWPVGAVCGQNSSQAGGTERGGTMATVLVVGHEIDLVTLMRWMLEDEGYVVVHAADGEAALATLRTCPQALIVLLLTIRPHVHTVDILEAAVAEAAVKRHAFVLFTAASQFLPARWRKLVRVLAVPVIAKPSGVKQVLGTIADVAARQCAPC
jgi:CheY-like chemotaxis protein